ncbi:hypothetical protein EDD85DRAFT_587691 [Armillaria nabsnona]|nr:hypothetical protein EDD85DRAFT_587691 [Armillaria nabsnona]
MVVIPRSLAQVSRTSISTFFRDICYNPRNKHRDLERVYDGILEPCLTNKSHYVRGTQSSLSTVHVKYHDYPNLAIPDFFSGLGYVLAHVHSCQPSPDLKFLTQLLSQYSEWCRISAALLEVNPPTVVQLLWSMKCRRFSLASSVAAGKGDGRDEVREERVKSLEAVWPDPLTKPTPMQQQHALAGTYKVVDSSTEIFGTPWGHCGESISFASLFETIHKASPLATLALSVKSMTSMIPGTNIVPVQVIPHLNRMSDIIEVLRVSGSLRPMCLNCQHLAKGRVDDYAHHFMAKDYCIHTAIQSDIPCISALETAEVS